MKAERPGNIEQPEGDKEITVQDFVKDDAEFSDKPEFMAFGLLAAGVPININRKNIDLEKLEIAQRIASDLLKGVARYQKILKDDRDRKKNIPNSREYEKLKKRRQRARKKS
jgi:hypothetical protein